VIVRSTAADALALRGGLLLDSTVADGSTYMGSAYYGLNGTTVAAVRAKEFVADEYGLAFQTFNIAGLVERMRLTGDGELLVPSQPGFFAYNSADDANQISGATIDFDVELYDEASNFAADTFSAPVTGRYLLCAKAKVLPDSTQAILSLAIETSNRTYEVDGGVDVQSIVDVIGLGGPCIPADMDAGDTAVVKFLSTDGAADIKGGAAPVVTFFSGRLLP
jgi:hypothetical protein